VGKEGRAEKVKVSTQERKEINERKPGGRRKKKRGKWQKVCRKTAQNCSVAMSIRSHLGPVRRGKAEKPEQLRLGQRRKGGGGKYDKTKVHEAKRKTG